VETDVPDELHPNPGSVSHCQKISEKLKLFEISRIYQKNSQIFERMKDIHFLKTEIVI